MARKNIIYGFKPFNPLNNADMASSLTSSEMEVGQLDYGSIYVSWSGSSINGTVEVQAKNGEDGTYRPFDFGSTITLSGSSGFHDLTLNDLPFTHLKIVYTRSAGTGTLNAEVTLKSRGA
jgi:hypothetical protein